MLNLCCAQRPGTVRCLHSLAEVKINNVAFQQEMSPSQVDPPPVLFDFAYLRAVGDAMNETRDCAIIATTVVTGEGYPKIHELYKKLGRRNRCGTQFPLIHTVFDMLGFKLHPITNYYDGASVRSIAPQLPSKGKFLVRTRKHVAAIIDGAVVDWSEQRKLYVKEIYQVTDKDEPMPMPTKRTRKVIIDYEKPTKAVWTVADILMEDELLPETYTRKWWSTFRAKVVAECQANGINKTTASVQVGKWMADNGFRMGYMI